MNPVTRVLAAPLLGAVIAVAAPAVAPAQGAITPVPVDSDVWFGEPCRPDSSDDFGWTRYDLHGIRLRVPPGTRQVKYPNIDELHFRAGGATMRLRLHRDASQLFTQYNRPDLTHRYCTDDVGGQRAEVVSFRRGAYGFAARWPDADRGEWLTAVIQGPRLDEILWLRRALFTISFPSERRQ